MNRMLLGCHTIGFGVFFAYVTNIPLTWWLAWSTNFVDLSEIEQPVISVATVASSGDPYYQTAGLAGKRMMASGSQPPFAATHIGNTRLLDGGLTDELPTAILASAGAKLIIAAQPIPKVYELPQIPEHIPIPHVVQWWFTSTPWVRALDYMRGYFMVFRQAARGSEQHAHVCYNAATRRSFAGSWYAAKRIAHEAASSPALGQAVAEAKCQWQALLAGPRKRVRLDLASKQVEVGSDVELRFVEEPGGDWRLSADAQQVLAVSGRFVAMHAATLEVTLIDVPVAVARPRLFEAAAGLSPEKIAYVVAPPADSLPTFTLAIR